MLTFSLTARRPEKSTPGSPRIPAITTTGMSAGCGQRSILSESWSEPTTMPDLRTPSFRLSGLLSMAHPLRHDPTRFCCLTGQHFSMSGVLRTGGRADY